MSAFTECERRQKASQSPGRTRSPARASRTRLAGFGWVRLITVTLLLSPCVGTCGAVASHLMIGGTTATVGVAYGDNMRVQENEEIRQHRLRRARGEE